ncbi:MAG: helix-turn-helix domain-containing protein, partial [Pyrinomonadaceae bacterium]
MNQQSFDPTSEPEFESQAPLGEKLRRAREARGAHLRDISEQTNISTRYLQAIENDDYSSLPGGIFNRGFVKAYARCVGLGEEEAMRSYTATVRALGQEVDPDPLAAGRLRRVAAPPIQEGRTAFSNAFWSVMVLSVIVLCTLAVIHYYRRTSNSTTNREANSEVRAENNNRAAPLGETKASPESVKEA